MDAATSAAVTTIIPDVAEAGFSRAFEAASWLKTEMHRVTGEPPATGDTFALLLVDGLSLCEERLVSAISSALGGIHLVGGSAGDHFRGKRGVVLRGDDTAPGGALLALVRTTAPFRAFSTHHFSITDRRMLVTRADPARRIVQEINGEPAAEEYARMIGRRVDDLTPEVLAATPPAVKIGGSFYLRSVRLVSTDPGEGLGFTCAIDDGIVLRVAERRDMIADLTATLYRLEQQLGPLSSVIGFDCALRLAEARNEDRLGAVEHLFRANAVGGMATYGEQLDRMHLNQTFTGLAFGIPRHG